MTNDNDVEKSLDLLGYTDSKTHNVVLDMFALFDGNDLTVVDRERILRVAIELTSPKGLDELPDAPVWTPFELGVTRVGQTVRVRSEGYVGKASWHLGKVGRIVAVRAGRVIIQYIGRSDGMGHYHHPEMIEVLKNG